MDIKRVGVPLWTLEEHGEWGGGDDSAGRDGNGDLVLHWMVRSEGEWIIFWVEMLLWLLVLERGCRDN